MPLIYVVRHGRVDASHPLHRDPPLDALGHGQAQAVAQRLHAQLPRPLAVISSPLTRCRETAAPLARLWQTEIRIEPRIRELPAPDLPRLQRSKWIAEVVRMRWSDVARSTEAICPGYTAQLALWRAELHQALLDCRADTVAYSHFVAINALAAAADDDGPLARLQPGHASISRFETDGGRLRFIDIETLRPDAPPV